jgi:hypothetical protein
MLEFFKKLNERAKVQEERRKARRAQMTPWQKRAEKLIYAAVGSVFVIGWVSSTMFSAGVVAIVGLDVALRRLHGKPVFRLGLLTSVALPFAPIIVMGLAPVMMSDKTSELIATSRAQIEKHSDRIAEDVDLFAREFEAGRVVAHVGTGVGRQYRTVNDQPAHWLMKQVVKLSTPAGLRAEDLAAAIPVVELTFADKTVVLISRGVMKAFQEREEAEISELTGKAYDDLTVAEYSEAMEARRDRYKGIFMTTCILDRKGGVMSMTAGPSMVFADVLNESWISPLREACEAFGPDRPAPHTLAPEDF